MAPLIAVTDHAAERYRQRVRGTLDARGEITERVGRAWAAGAVSSEPPPLSRASRSPPLRSAAAQRGSVYVRDGQLVFVCLDDRPRGELVVVTLWEEGEDAAVPRRFTAALKREDRRASRRDDGRAPEPDARRGRGLA
jgi:hypothetical protein